MSDITNALNFAAEKQYEIEHLKREKAALTAVVATQGSKIAKLEHENKQLRKNVKRLRGVCDEFHAGNVAPKALQNVPEFLELYCGEYPTYSELARMHTNQARTIRLMQIDRKALPEVPAEMNKPGLGQGTALETTEDFH